MFFIGKSGFCCQGSTIFLQEAKQPGVSPEAACSISAVSWVYHTRTFNCYRRGVKLPRANYCPGGRAVFSPHRGHYQIAAGLNFKWGRFKFHTTQGRMHAHAPCA